MFRDTLLESSPAGRKPKRWPMATAFAVEVAVAGLLIVLPLLSRGVITVSAHPPIGLPLADMPRAAHDQGDSQPISGSPHYRANHVVIAVGNTHLDNCFTNCEPARNDDDQTGPPNWDSAIGSKGPTRSLNASNAQKPVLAKPLVVSELSMAQLTHRVEPVYPKMAILIHIEGQVLLHAIVARDGSIRSVEVMRGHPLLAGAAMDAVRQWRYQPYKLNGEPVEVETLITVNFRATGN